MSKYIIILSYLHLILSLQSNDIICTLTQTSVQKVFFILLLYSLFLLYQNVTHITLCPVALLHMIIISINI